LWRESGQTIRGFCREEGLVESAFHFWKRELLGSAGKGAARSDPSAPRFVPVSASGPMAAPLTLEFHGATLRIEAGVDAQLLRTVLESLRAG